MWRSGSTRTSGTCSLRTAGAAAFVTPRTQTCIAQAHAASGTPPAPKGPPRGMGTAPPPSHACPRAPPFPVEGGGVEGDVGCPGGQFVGQGMGGTHMPLTYRPAKGRHFGAVPLAVVSLGDHTPPSGPPVAVHLGPTIPFLLHPVGPSQTIATAVPC